MATDYFSELIGKFFSPKPEKGSKQILIREKLVRTTSFGESRKKWIESGEGPEILMELKRQYMISNSGNGNNTRISLYKSREANGFAIGSDWNLKTEWFQYLMDHFRDRLLDTGYRLYTSDRQIGEKGDAVIQIDRHYLKPPPVFSEELIYNQLFGNVLIELTIKDEQVHTLKLLATVYAGRQYSEPQSFEELTERLFSVS